MESLGAVVESVLELLQMLRSQMLSTVTGRYAERDDDCVSALRAAAEPDVATAVSSATVARAGPDEL